MSKHIFEVMGILSVEFGDRFRITKERVALWNRILGDVNPDDLRAAAVKLASDNEQYPPTVGQVRHQALRISGGALLDDNATAAWCRVMDYNSDRIEKSALNESDLFALKHIGGTWEIKHSENHGILRSQFIQAWKDHHKMLVTHATAVPEVLNMLPEPVSHEKRLGGTTEQKTDERGNSEPVTDEDIARMINGIGFGEVQ
jgi:hypothetical protein